MCFCHFSLRPLDVECMKALHEKVNIIPVLAKADCLTQAEVCRKKMKVRGSGAHPLQFKLICKTNTV